MEEQEIVSSEENKKKFVKKDADSADDSEPEQPDSNPEPEQPADDNMIDFNMGKYIVKYTGHAIGTDYEGTPCLIVYYDFTNNSDEITSAQMSAYIRVFQNGVQCESAILNDRGYKKELYEKSGVKEYWIVDPVMRSIEAYLLSDGKYNLDEFYGLFPDSLVTKKREQKRDTCIPVQRFLYPFRRNFPEFTIKSLLTV